MKNGHETMPDGLSGLLYQLLETEIGGVNVYETALQCVSNDELEEEWQKYLEETKRHVEIATSLLKKLGLDPKAEVPARKPVRAVGEGLVTAMKKAKTGGTPEEAQLTAAECVVLAETKDHMNWELIGLIAEKSELSLKKALEEAHEQVEKQEDHHLYHTTGWARELWIEALGLPAALPPPEEIKQVETAIGAARAKNARREMI
jgi:hypothetical protein